MLIVPVPVRFIEAAGTFVNSAPFPLNPSAVTVPPTFNLVPEVVVPTSTLSAFPSIFI